MKRAAAASSTDGSQNGLALKCSSVSAQSIGSNQKVKSLSQIDLFQHTSPDYVYNRLDDGREKALAHVLFCQQNGVGVCLSQI